MGAYKCPLKYTSLVLIKPAEVPRFQLAEDMALLVYIHKGDDMYSLSAILHFSDVPQQYIIKIPFLW